MNPNIPTPQNLKSVSDEINELALKEETDPISDIFGDQTKEQASDAINEQEIAKITGDENFSLDINQTIGSTRDKNTNDEFQTNNKSVDNKNKNDVLIYTMPRQFSKGKGHLEKNKKRPHSGKTDLGSVQSKTGETSSQKQRVLPIVLIIVLLCLVGAASFFGYKMFLEEKFFPKINTDIQPPIQVEPVPTEAPVADKPPVEPEPNPEPAPTETQPPANPDDAELNTLLGADLIQKPVISYDDHGLKTTAAVLSIEKEPEIKYSRITLQDHIIDKKLEFFTSIVGSPYEVRLRGEKPTAKAVLTITYPENALVPFDVIPADVRIGFMPFELLDEELYRMQTTQEKPTTDTTERTNNEAETNTETGIALEPSSPALSPKPEPPLIWEILKARDVDADMNSVSSIMNKLREGIYAIVPLDINSRIELPEPPQETQPPNGTAPIFGNDSDSDMLTDQEELIYGTSPTVEDSDGDGFSDGEEVAHLFSPARGAGVRLEDDAQFSRFVNSESGFTILYPNAITPSFLQDGSLRDTLFTSKDNEAVLVSVQDNLGKLPLQDWLISISPNINITDFESFTTLSKYTALKAPNKTTYYIQIPDTAFIIVFSYTSPAEYNYATTERMMAESVKQTIASQ